MIRCSAQAADLASWNRTLEQRVQQQLVEIERVEPPAAISVAADREPHSLVRR